MIKAFKTKSGTFNTKLEPLIYITPFAIGLIIFTIYPAFNVLLMSFKEGYRLSGAFKAIGLKNYITVLNDPLFKSAIYNTFVYVFTVIPISTVISIVIANLLNQKIKGIAFFHTAYFLPLVTSAVAIGSVWKYMFNTNYGVINWALGLFGIAPIEWLGMAGGSVAMNLAVVIIYGIWNKIPFTTILLLSGLQGIDPLYYTAAKVDGAGSMKIFTRITVPLLMPTIFLTLIVNSISAFKVYSEIIPFWSGNAGYTNKNLYTMVYYIKEAFYTDLKLGKAAAAAILLFLIIFVFTMIQLAVQKRYSDRQGE